MDADGPPDRGVYGITTTADLTGVPVPTLRLYERRGLIEPGRTEGGTRRDSDSDNDLALLGRIGALVSEGGNCTGVAHVLTLQAANAALSSANEDLETENTRMRPAGRTPTPLSGPARPRHRCVTTTSPLRREGGAELPW